MRPVLFRIGDKDQNWKASLGDHVWGLPDKRDVEQVNSLIKDDGGVVAMFLSPGGSKRHGRIIALSLVTEPIQPFAPGEEDQFGWHGQGSNTLYEQLNEHKFSFKVQLGNIMYLRESDELLYSALRHHNGVNHRKEPKHINQVSMQIPKGPLCNYLVDICKRYGSLFDN